MNVAASAEASKIVNHAPSGTFINADERKVPSRHANMSQGSNIIHGRILQTISAVRVVNVVSKNAVGI
jgi:hypothetical protein